MATPILRTIDRWRFETPLALVLAAAAGFAVMAMPHPLFAQIPTVGGFGRLGRIGLALLAALVCGSLGYVAMRSPAKRAVAVEDEAHVEDLDAPVDLPSAAAIEEEPLRLRRADRHPDAPPRAPIRASRDLGEPFMAVGSPVTPGGEGAFAGHEPAEVAIDHDALAAFETEPQVEVEPVPAEPVAPEALAEAPVVEEPAIAEATPAPTPRPLPSSAREDASISAMMERLSAGMQRRGGAIGRPIGAVRQGSPALRDALDELNRLAQRRG